jgi:SAM-dependent methyltransferase
MRLCLSLHVSGCEERNLKSVSFFEAALSSLSFSEAFDAVVGRLVLLYQPDPVMTIRQSASLLRPGGIIAFYESDLSAPCSLGRQFLFGSAAIIG